MNTTYAILTKNEYFVVMTYGKQKNPQARII